ncbi:unnamed protein product, partial [Mesorhabditis belari]|uniref:Uncharacterized protein n=1 Tax=Mesorhabditis belari TaxID=2138241 RepID=A0AAF3EMN7_9BILA
MLFTHRRRWFSVIVLTSLILTFFLFMTTIGPKINRDAEIVMLNDAKDFNVIVIGSEIDPASRKPVTETKSTKGSEDSNKKICNVPKLDKDAADVARFFKSETPTHCYAQPNWAFIDSNGRFATILSKATSLCQVQAIQRQSDHEMTYGQWIDIRVGDPLPSDFVKVNCSLGEHNWDGLLMSVVRNEKAVERAKNRKQPAAWSELDVFILGHDSASHMMYLRKLPKTVAYFEKIMGGVVFDAYNIVGDGTARAFVPILTGQTEEELPLTRQQWFSKSYYVDDVYPFIWKNFSDAGYVTLYGEDEAQIGTFTFRMKGFKNQPTDHYTRTYFQEHEKLHGRTRCSGSSPFYESWFRYSKEFMKTYKDFPRFLLMFMGTFSHSDYNRLGQVDDAMVKHLKEMHEGGFFDRALVVMMGDHGARFDELRNTHQGQLEERLPFFGFALPKKLREGKMKAAWENLLRNKEILSTPFDIHATLMDVLHIPSEQKLKAVQNASKRSLSLFRPLPLSRTCEQAGVAPHWCTCLDWENITNLTSTKDLLQRIALVVVETINNLTKPHRALCAPLHLKALIHAQRMVPNEALLKFKKTKDSDQIVPDFSGTNTLGIVYYQLKLITTPGDAEYEITLRHELSSNNLIVDLTSISHINRYGDRPHCIIEKNYFLGTYCVCYDKI